MTRDRIPGGDPARLSNLWAVPIALVCYVQAAVNLGINPLEYIAVGR